MTIRSRSFPTHATMSHLPPRHRKKTAKGLGLVKTNKSTNIYNNNSNIPLARAAVSYLSEPSADWFEHAPSSANRRLLAYKHKLIGARVMEHLLACRQDLITLTTDRSARVVLSVLVSKLLTLVSEKLGRDNAQPHKFRQCADWGDSQNTRGSGLALTDSGYAAFAMAAQSVRTDLSKA